MLPLFFPFHCVFQDLKTGQIIGHRNETNGLYIMGPIKKEQNRYSLQQI